MVIRTYYILCWEGGGERMEGVCRVRRGKGGGIQINNTMCKCFVVIELNNEDKSKFFDALTAILQD